MFGKKIARIIQSVDKKSQAAMEMLIILAVGLSILLAVLVVNNKIIIGTSGKIESAKARSAIDSLSNAAELVYQQGVGSRTRVFVSLPDEIQNFSASNKILTMQIYSGGNLKDVYRTFDFNVSAIFPTEEGNYWLYVEAKQGYVYFGENITVDIVCGNNIKEAGENCDGVDLNGQSCVDLGYTSGTLSCYANCSYDTSSCTSFHYGDGAFDSVLAGIGAKNIKIAYAFDLNGIKLWNNSYADNVLDVAAADFDRDGFLDDAIIASDRVYAYNETGGAIWSYASGVIKSVAAIDSNSDGYLDEVAAGGQDDIIYVINSAGGIVWNYTTGGDIPERVAIAALDLDADGFLDDVLVASHDDTVYALDETGAVVWNYTSPSALDMKTVAALDIDADGYLDDAVVGGKDDIVLAFDETGNLIWNYTTAGDIKEVIALDLDADGFLDDAASVGNDDTIYVFNETGSVIWSFTSPSNLDMKAIAAADFDGDGYLDDVVAGSKDDIVYAFDSNGVLLWNYTAGSDVKAVAAADLQ